MEILHHRRIQERKGRFLLRVKWEDQTTSLEHWKDLSEDDPITTSAYIETNISVRPKNPDMTSAMAWAKRSFATLNLMATPSSATTLMLTSNSGGLPCKSKFFGSWKQGVYIPKGYKDAMRDDARNGNSTWSNAVEKELSKLRAHDAVHFLRRGASRPKGYSLLRYHYVFDVKGTGEYKARIVADGHLMDNT